MKKIKVYCLLFALILSFVSCTEEMSSESRETSSSEHSVITETESNITTVSTSETTITTAPVKLFGNDLRNYTKKDIIEKIFHNNYNSFDFTGGQAAYPTIENKSVCPFQFMFSSLEANWNRQLESVSDDNKPYMIRALSGAWINQSFQVGMKYSDIKKKHGIKGLNRSYCSTIDIDGISWSVYFDLSESDRNNILKKYEELTGKSKETFEDLDNTSFIDVSDIDPISLHATYIANTSNSSETVASTTSTTIMPTTTTTTKATATTKATTEPVTTTKKPAPKFNENEMYAAYAAAVKENVNDNLIKMRLGGYFVVFDIDGDGIPELYFHNGGGTIETSSVFSYNITTKKAEKLDGGFAEPFYSKTRKCILGKAYQRWVYSLCKCYKKNKKVVTEEILKLQVNDTMGVQYYDNLDKIEKTEKEYQMVALQETEISTNYLSNNQKLLSDLKANYTKNRQIMK